MILALKKTVCKNSHAAVIFFGLFSWSRESRGKKYFIFCMFCYADYMYIYIYEIFFSSLSFPVRNSGNFSAYNSFCFLFQFELTD